MMSRTIVHNITLAVATLVGAVLLKVAARGHLLGAESTARVFTTYVRQRAMWRAVSHSAERWGFRAWWRRRARLQRPRCR